MYLPKSPNELLMSLTCSKPFEGSEFSFISEQTKEGCHVLDGPFLITLTCHITCRTQSAGLDSRPWLYTYCQ